MKTNHAKLALTGALALAATVPLLLLAVASEPADTPDVVAHATAEKAPSASDRLDALDRETLRNEAGSTAAYAAPVGTRLSFELYSSTHHRMTNTDEHPIHAELLRVRGTMEVLVVARRAGECAVEVTFSELAECGDTPQGPDGLRDDLARGTLVHMGDDGRLLGYRFAEAFHPRNRNRLRSIISDSAFIARLDGQAWESREPGASGISLVDYRWHGAGGDMELTKTRRAYESHAGEPVPMVMRHAAHARFDRDVGWLRSCRAEEQLELRLDAQKLVIRVALEGRMDLHAVSQESIAAVGDTFWTEPWSPVCGADDTIVFEDLTAQRRDRLATYSTTDCLRALAALLADRENIGPLLAERARLIEMLQLFPERTAEIAAWVHVQPADNELLGVVLSAVGAAATPQAQDLLGAVAADLAKHSVTRQLSLRCMLQIGKPTVALLDTVGAVAADAQADADVTAASLLVLGALTRRAPSHPQAARQLLALESMAGARGQIETWLGALGNAGLDAAVPVAARYLDALDTHTRVNALEAIRKVRSAPARRLLIERASGDADPGIRAAAAEQLCAHGDGASLAHVGTMLADPDHGVRRTALRGLAKRATDPVARALLERIATRDPEPKLRARAREALAH